MLSGYVMILGWLFKAMMVGRGFMNSAVWSTFATLKTSRFGVLPTDVALQASNTLLILSFR